MPAFFQRPRSEGVEDFLARRRRVTEDLRCSHLILRMANHPIGIGPKIHVGNSVIQRLCLGNQRSGRQDMRSYRTPFAFPDVEVAPDDHPVPVFFQRGTECHVLFARIRKQEIDNHGLCACVEQPVEDQRVNRPGPREATLHETQRGRCLNLRKPDVVEFARRLINREEDQFRTHLRGPAEAKQQVLCGKLGVSERPEFGLHGDDQQCAQRTDHCQRLAAKAAQSGFGRWKDGDQSLTDLFLCYSGLRSTAMHSRSRCE